MINSIPIWHRLLPPSSSSGLSGPPIAAGRVVFQSVMTRLVRATRSSTFAAIGSPEKPGHDELSNPPVNTLILVTFEMWVLWRIRRAINGIGKPYVNANTGWYRSVKQARFASCSRRH